MIEVINNQNGFSCVCEYYLVDKFGNHTKEGEYLCINDLRIAKGHKVIKDLIKLFLEKYPKAKFCYFKRKKYHKTFFHFRRSYERFVKN